MYTVLGFEEFVSQDGRNGWAYFVGKEIKNGFKPAVTVYSKVVLPDISVGDIVFPDLETTKEGKLIARGLFKV